VAAAVGQVQQSRGRLADLGNEVIQQVEAVAQASEQCEQLALTKQAGEQRLVELRQKHEEQQHQQQLLEGGSREVVTILQGLTTVIDSIHACAAAGTLQTHVPFGRGNASIIRRLKEPWKRMFAMAEKQQAAEEAEKAAREKAELEAREKAARDKAEQDAREEEAGRKARKAANAEATTSARRMERRRNIATNKLHFSLDHAAEHGEEGAWIAEAALEFMTNQ
jgi:hypothetical protein